MGEVCGENGVCNSKGGCGVCLPGAERCDGNAIASCDEEGQWGKEVCPENRPLCSGKTCLGVKRISTGPSASCAHFDDNSVRCFGAQGFRAEDGITQIGSLLGALDIALGGSFGCALLSGGAVSCWGANEFGQVGDGTIDKTTPRAPTPVLGLSKAMAIAAGFEFACAILEGGKVACWGRGEHGELGAPPLSAKAAKQPASETEDDDDSAQNPGGPPSLVPSLSGSATITFGGTFGCALFPGGRIGCFGSNDQNQRGGQVAFDGPSKPKIAPKPKPTLVAIKGIEGATSIKLGKRHACVILADGTARCWGDNTHGQLGDGTTTTKQSPVVVKDLQNIQSLALGSFFSCALLKDHTARCWGDNTHGQLGDGTTEQRPAPVPASNLASIQKLIAGGTHACGQLSDGQIKCWGGNTQNELGDRTTDDRTTPVPIAW
jgi:alpha-tubulin suppressor-like RCC1 family protein